MTRKGICLLVTASAIALVMFPRAAQGQRSGVEIWSRACGFCHIAQPPDRYTAKDWDSIGMHMIITARLTDAEGDAVLAFLKGSALQPGDSQDSPDAPAASEARVPELSGAQLTPELSEALAKYIRELDQQVAEQSVVRRFAVWRTRAPTR